MSAVLEAHSLSKSFQSLRVIEDVSLQLVPGEILGLVGPNGSGKTTLINLLSGYLRADGGTITLDGHVTHELPTHRVASLGLARTFQIPRPFQGMSVLDNVKVGAYFGRASGGVDVDREALAALDVVGLGAYAERPVSVLTLHQRKFLEIARALACRPHVLLLDEMLAGLNPTEIDAAIHLIRGLTADGTAILLVEHIMRAVVSLCSRVTVLSAGVMIAEGRPDVCLRDPAVIEAYLGRGHD